MHPDEIDEMFIMCLKAWDHYTKKLEALIKDMVDWEIKKESSKEILKIPYKTTSIEQVLWNPKCELY